MTKTLTTPSFARLREETQALLRASLPEHMERLGWDAARIAEHQRAGLRRLVARAIEHSPFHRRRLAGVDAGALELSDLASLPVMTKAEMMDELDDVLTDRRITSADVERALDATTTEPVPFGGGYIAMASGGSSGRRGVFCFDRHAIVTFQASLVRSAMVRVQALGGPPTGGLHLAMVCAPTSVHATGTAPAYTAAGDGPFRFHAIPVTSPLPVIVDRLNELQAPMLYGYPSMLARLAEEQRAGRLQLQLLAITSTSETLLPELREAIRDGFGVPIVDTFGSTEGLLGVSAPDEDVLVFNDDECIVELVDEQNRPVPDGTPSAKILVTNLFNRLQPLIRYEINDRFVRQPADPAHGHLRAKVEGRADDVLVYGDVTVHPLVVRAVMVKTPTVADYQVCQTANGIDVSAVGDSTVDTERLQGRLVRALVEAGLREPEVTVVQVERLERDERTGKIRRFQPLR
jgi:phenylacetate-coenzyme A ligase PaaK-like adenylate-forming protein